jgi:ADP-heptose:LPS heptosyltransferase
VTQHEPLIFRDDCEHYLGDRPCVHNRLCHDCPHYAPQGKRICVIKIGALGDVIRTLCILPHLKDQNPDCQITWVTSPAAMPFIHTHRQIDQLLPFNHETALALTHQQFDLLISLDKEAAPTGLAMSIRADRKLGIGLSAAGKPVPLNAEGRPYFALGLSDELKFNENRDGYPKLVYEALGWRYEGQTYALDLEPAARALAEQRLTENGWRSDQPTLGVNVGAAATFANKMWPVARIADLLRRLHVAEPTMQVVLLGGEAERDRMAELHATLPWLIHSGHDNDPQTFLGVIDHCDAIFCGDTLAMHLAIARKRGVVAFFGPTCEQEIELFGLGEKLIAGTACSPCYKRNCDMQDACLDAIPTHHALDSVRRVVTERFAERRTSPLFEKAG